MRRHGRSRRNPVKSGLDSNTIILLGMGTALLGAIVYAIYQVGQANDTLASTNDQIAQASQNAENVSAQIGGASESAQSVAAQIAAANATVNQQAASPAATAAQGIANWWNSL